MDEHPTPYADRVRECMRRRESGLRRLGFEDYATYIKSSLWKETRSRYWHHPETSKVCGLCGTAEPPLDLHHRTYDRVGAERLEDLVAVCVPCHHLIHSLASRGDIDGLDADLGVLVDARRAARYREQRRLPEVSPVRETEVQRQKVARRLADAKRELAKAEAMKKPKEHLDRVRRRLRRTEGKLRWLERHPALQLDPLSVDHRVHERMRLRMERRASGKEKP